MSQEKDSSSAPVASGKDAAPSKPRKTGEKTAAAKGAAAKKPTTAKKAAAPKKTATKATPKSALKTAPKKTDKDSAPAAQAQPAAATEAKPKAKSPAKARPRTRAASKKAPAEQVQPAAAQGAEKSADSHGAQPEQKPAQPAPAVKADEHGDAAQAAPAAQAQSAAAPGEGAAPGEQGSSSSRRRRSRRGGRRRNKNKNVQAQLEAGSAALSNLDDAQPAQDSAAVKAAPKAPADADDAHDNAQSDADLDADLSESDDDSAPAAEPKAKGKSRGDKRRGGKGKKAAKDADGDDDDAPSGGQARKMFISVLSGEQVEVVLTEEGMVQEYYIEMQHQAKVKGNIYKGVVSNIDANLQAAFISYAGGVKNGFLQIDEVHPEYYLVPHDPNKGRKYPLIQKALKPGQEILVQVVKEPAGTKGAFVTSYLSLPGRFLVLTPGREQIGVSRKVENEEERARLRELLEGLTPGKGLGVIIRTVSRGASKTSLQRDLQFLKRLWKEVRDKGKNAPAPSLIYQELDLSTRAVRDYLTDEVQEVWVDDANTAKQVSEFATLLFPKKQNMVQVHKDAAATLFERFSIQKQLDQIQSREVALPSGGRLVFDNTEALTAIDINSGRSSGKSNFEDMAYRTNLEAARMIPLQLRLRDIGGQVVADFIEMRDHDHWREVEKAVRNGMKGDRARYDVGKIGPFGMLEIVRQRLGSSAISLSTEPCPCCKGTGIRRNMEWQALQALREIHKLLRQAAAGNQASTTAQFEPELAFYLLNAKRGVLQDMEKQFGVSVQIRPLAG